VKAWSIVRLYTARRDGGDDSHGGINIELADLDFDVQRARDYFRGARAAANGGDEDNPLIASLAPRTTCKARI
jgi:hypothetical protein